MGHLPKLCGDVAAHTLGGRVGVVELWMARLQLLQLLHEEVELLVVNDGLVQYVVAVVVLVQLASELFNAECLVHGYLLFVIDMQMQRYKKKSK